MRRLVCTVLVAATPLSPAFSLDLPARKPGLWEISIIMEGGRIPPQVTQNCIDAETDKVMSSIGSDMRACAKQDVQRSGGSIVIDSICTVGGMTVTSHSVVTGDFNAAYTVKTRSKRSGAAVPGVPATGETQMIVQAKWLGACKPDQKPGDMIMANGVKINIRDMQKAATGIPAPKR
jgi:hypothetical protein